jgi:hypothetical protein
MGRNLMAKKILRVEVIAEMEVDTDWYDGLNEEGIINVEGNNWIEWIGDNYISEKITLREKSS